jgi:hypothetical protein
VKSSFYRANLSEKRPFFLLLNLDTFRAACQNKPRGLKRICPCFPSFFDPFPPFLSVHMPAQPFSPAEQYGFTSGLCHVFAKAAHELLGGQPTILNATDPRQLAEHDWPVGEPLHLHNFLLFPDGTAVDGEGRRPLEDLLKGFGVRRGYRHELIPDPSWAHILPPAPADKTDARRAWVACLKARIQEQGWTIEDVPPATNALAKTAAFRQASQVWRDEQLVIYQALQAQHMVTAPSTSAPRRRRLR